MSCLMAKNVHAGENADAAEEKSGAEQDTFRNAPSVPDRTAFVDAHDGKAEKIDQDHIKDKECFHIKAELHSKNQYLTDCT